MIWDNGYAHGLLNAKIEIRYLKDLIRRLEEQGFLDMISQSSEQGAYLVSEIRKEIERTHDPKRED